MEEDIKILEQYLNFMKEVPVGENVCVLWAIENLIKGYKLEKLKNTIDEQSLQEALKDYIPKSKVKEKIKELEQIRSTALTGRTMEMMDDKINILELILEE